VTFERCSWNGTHAGYGGGHFQTGGTVHFTDVSFSANTAGAGGAIFATGGAGVTLLGGVVSGASATGNGAGLHLDACVATLSNLRVDGASAGGLGGGLSIAAGGQVIASFCKFVECAAAQGGGAFHVSCDAGPAAGLFAPAAANIGGPASALTTDCALLSITHSDVLLSRGAAPAAGAVTDAAVLRIASSIVAGNQSGLACLDPRATLDVGCSDLYQNGGADLSGSCLPSASGATLAVDPRLCDLAGRDFGLCANSPLLDPGCGDAFWGAGGLSCGGCGPTPAQPLTWGKLKSLYRS
jgi:predicted outer membrane repeat protein